MVTSYTYRLLAFHQSAQLSLSRTLGTIFPNYIEYISPQSETPFLLRLIHIYGMRYTVAYDFKSSGFDRFLVYLNPRHGKVN